MKPLLTALLIFISCICFAQKNADSLYFVTMKDHIISMPKETNDTIYNLPFNNITIIDARPDTTSIGFFRPGNDKTLRVVFEKSLESAFKEFIEYNYRLSNDSNNLLIIIKEFRITNYAVSSGVISNSELNWNKGSIINAELFLNINDNYHALYKVDSIQLAESNHETIEALVKKSFGAILKKSRNKNLSAMHVGKIAFSFEDIKKHVADFNNYLILKTEAPAKGVYKSFNEFKNNNPSIINFEVKKGQLTDELFVTENNQSYLLQDVWGYSDGRNLFIRSANNFFQLNKIGNTFNIKGIKSFSQKYNKNVGNEVVTSYLLGVPMSTFIKNNYKAVPMAFQLNMQNGEMY